MENLILCIGDEEEEDLSHIFSVRQFTVHERMNRCFEVRILAVSKLDDLPFDDIVGQPTTFSLFNPLGIWRGYSGVVARCELMRTESTGKNLYEIQLVPDLWRLSLRKNHRIFQHMTPREIIDTVLTEYDITTQEWYLDRQDYPKHEYRVQYGESDLDFITRICEENGISYYFWDDPEDEEVESHLQFDDTPETSEVRYGDPIPYTDNPNEVQGSGEFVSEVTLMHDVRPGAVTIRDHDFRRRIDAQLFGNADPAPPPEDVYEQYIYDPNAFLYETDKADGSTPVADDKSKARHLDLEAVVMADIRIDALRVGKRHLTYRSSCHDLSPGVVFQMEHPREDLWMSYLLAIECHIHGKQDGEWVLRGHALFADDYYRPMLRVRKPKIHGLQSAIVVGPPGQEIYSDEFGRVRVRFHWDREGDFDDKRTCWLRVSQDWAGPMYGGLRLPRVDQEVLVDFLEGDPDNPIIVGRLYNATTRVPYPLPSRKTVSTYKSDTSPHDGGFNELLFEDAAGNELVYLQAQKDLWKLVKNDETETTGNDRTTNVTNVQQTFIGKADAHTAGVTHDVGVGATRVQKQDKKIVATVGDATFTLDGPNITIVGKSDLVFKAEGVLSIEGGPDVYVNCADAPAELWSQCQEAAKAAIAAAKDDVRERNQIITGAYADLFLQNDKYPWAAVAAALSSSIGAAMAAIGIADAELEGLADGATAQFVDLYATALLAAQTAGEFADYADKLSLPTSATDLFTGDSASQADAMTQRNAVNSAQAQAYGGVVPPAAAATPDTSALEASRTSGAAAGGQYATLGALVS